MEPVAFTTAGPDEDGALFDLFRRVRGHDLGAGAWPEAIRLSTLTIQYNAQRRGYAEQCPSASTCFLTRGGERAGWAIVDRSGGAIHVVDIAVLPEVRGQGIATAALRALQDEAAREARAMTLSVHRDNAGAIRLYSRLGFKTASADDSYLYLEWRPFARAQTFRPAIDTPFEVVLDGPPLLLPLKEVHESEPSGGYDRFSLLFHGPGHRLLPQGLYTLRHPVIGEQALFLVPVAGSTRECILYEACFSVPAVRSTP